MTPTEIVIHHSGTEDSPDTYSWAAIKRWHMGAPPNGNGWLDIGYHGGVERAGDGVLVLQFGRPWDMDGAHTLGHNARALGFCFVGNFTTTPPDAALLSEGARLLRLWMSLYRIPKERIFLHRELNATDCPGDAFDKAALLALL